MEICDSLARDALRRDNPEYHRYCPYQLNRDRGYVGESMAADRLRKAEIKQVRCPICKLWRWPYELCPEAIASIRAIADGKEAVEC